MGFLDKAKQVAEQAQQKLEETQKQFNESQANKAAGDAPGVRYDANGRPIPADPATAGDASKDPATAQGVTQPQPPAAAEAIEDQPGAQPDPPGAQPDPPVAQPDPGQPAQAPPVKDGVNATPDPFKPIQ